MLRHFINDKNNFAVGKVDLFSSRLCPARERITEWRFRQVSLSDGST